MKNDPYLTLSGGGRLYFEVPPTREVIRTERNVGHESPSEAFAMAEDSLGPFLAFCESLQDQFKNLALSEFQVDMGLAVKGEGNAWVVKASAEANLKVSLKWKRETASSS